MKDLLTEAVQSCLQSTKFNCYVVDDGGFIVFTNDQFSDVSESYLCAGVSLCGCACVFVNLICN